MFEKIKKWFSQGLWTEDMVLDAIGKGAITHEQADRILKREA